MFNRSYHFIPGSKPKLLERIPSLEADCFVLDLEDGVSEEEKLLALGWIDDWLGSEADLSRIYVRVNGDSHPIAAKERDCLCKFPDVGVVLPKVSSPSVLSRMCDFYALHRGRRIIGLIESARGLGNLDEILAMKQLSGVALGLEDFLCHSVHDASSLGLLVATIRSKIALLAMSWQIEAIDTVSLDLEAGKELACEIYNARASGMTGKFSIHPKQIAMINSEFSPSSENIDKALRIRHKLGETLEGKGYFRFENEIISPPKIEKIKTTLKFIEYHGCQ